MMLWDAVVITMHLIHNFLAKAYKDLNLSADSLSSQ